MGVNRGSSGAHPDLGPESPAASLTALPDPAIAIPPGRGPGRVELSAAYGAFFLAIGVYQPFFPVFLSGRGLSAEAIGLAAAVPTLVKLAAQPAAGLLWDRLDRPRLILGLMGLGAAAGFTLAGLASVALTILFAVALAAIFFTPIFALMDAFAVRVGRLRAVDYGRARLWGSAAFIAGNLVAGFALDGLTDAAIIWLIVLPFLLFALSAWVLPALPPTRAPHDDARTAAEFVSTRLMLGIGAVALVQASHGLLYALGSVHWAASGFSPGLIGALWSLGVIAEIVLFTYGGRAVARLTALPLIALGGIAALVRFAAMAFDPPAAYLLALQLLHGLTFGATHLGLVALIAATVPDRALGRAQAYASTAISVAVGLATIASGPLYSRYGAAAYWSSAGFGLIGALLALAAPNQRRSPPARGSGDRARRPRARA
jgi:PPP family 3-phenylpropionic acid transporter